MGKFIRLVIMNILNSWWLKGHLIIVIIIGLIGIQQFYAPIKTIRKEITYEKIKLPTRVSGYGGKITIRKSTPKPVPTKITTIIIPTSVSRNTSTYPACFYNVTQYYGQNGEQGDDFGCGFHTLIPALWSGIIVAGEKTCWNVSCTSTSGGVIVINSMVPNLGFETTYYLHIDRLYPGIHIGEHIQKGQYIAYSGGQIYGGYWNANAQFSEGPHIEIGFSAWFLCQPDYHINCKGRNINPLYYIEKARDD